MNSHPFDRQTAVVAEARRKSPSDRGTSLNQLVRDFLKDLTRRDDPEVGRSPELEALWAGESYRSEGPWTREEIHERK